MDQSGAPNAFCRAVKAEGLSTTEAVLNESQMVMTTQARQLKSTQASPHTRTRRATASCDLSAQSPSASEDAHLHQFCKRSAKGASPGAITV
jgi:hypothetical protein